MLSFVASFWYTADSTKFNTLFHLTQSFLSTFIQPVLQPKEDVGVMENAAIDTKTTLADIRQV